jgi:membrane-bound lytic murein transglycosylase MltF
LLLALAAGMASAQVPDAARPYKRQLVANSRLVWGLDAPVASFGAQIEQESSWRPDVVSSAGAVGLAQFMPGTSSWISGIYRALADNQPRNPVWALRALVTYDRWLWERVTADNDCERFAMALVGYNGGLGNVWKEQALAERNGRSPGVWFGAVEHDCVRASWACRESRGYPRRIFTLLEPRYVAAGWGAGMCAGML